MKPMDFYDVYAYFDFKSSLGPRLCLVFRVKACDASIAICFHFYANCRIPIHVPVQI
jgi:hypothetical protein